jgi:hypothetical protein
MSDDPRTDKELIELFQSLTDDEIDAAIVRLIEKGRLRREDSGFLRVVPGEGEAIQ